MIPWALELCQKKTNEKRDQRVRDQLNSIIYIDFNKILVKIYIGFKKLSTADV